MTNARTVDVPCTVEIEQTAESFHAHAIPEGIEIRAGDRVLVHGAPSHVEFGSRISVPCRATVIRAGWFERVWTQTTALFELTQLYEVGFEPRETP
jgi:hypothetical protein